ncbi:methyltransferase domain-containing protein [soil metagenome]
MSELREKVRSRYAQAAREAAIFDETPRDGGAACCGDSAPSSCCGDDGPGLGSQLYDHRDREGVPGGALLASLGCGNPAAVVSLQEGETVLDLGSGGGMDVLLSARRVGPDGKAYGLDMTDEMLELARANLAAAGVENVEFLKGYIEAVPLPAATVDVIISNCVINLATDKQAVFEEMLRVLRPGGRIGISDVVASSELSPEERAERGSYVGCIAGALSFDEYEHGLAKAGFAEIDIRPTHQVADGMFSAIVKASKPGSD